MNNLCACGCGKPTRLSKHRYIAHHHKKGRHHTEEHRRHISEGNKGKHHLTEEAKNHLSKVRLGMKFSEEWKQHLSESHTGYVMPAEQKKKISMANKNMVFTDNHKRLISESRKGIIFSDEHRENLSISLKGKNTGKKPPMSEETKKKLRLATIRHQMKVNRKYKPNVGKNETLILDELEKLYGMKIIRNYPIDGYFVDGYIVELKLAIEVDEPHHYYFSGELKKKDLSRQNNIEQSLGCIFLRIRIDDNGVIL